MKLNKEEAKFLLDKWNDFYYYFHVESMYQKDQKILKYWTKIIGGKTMKVKAGEFILNDSGEVIWGSESFHVFKALYGDEYEYEAWSYDNALQKIKNLVQLAEDN